MCMASLFVVTPAFGGLTYSGYNLSILKLQSVCKEKELKFHVSHICNENSIMARNKLCNEFMKH